MPASEITTSPHLRLKCVHCGAGLEISVHQVGCAQCGASWPVESGIPRFFDPSYYWGEHARERAVELLKAAEYEGWQEAVKARVAGDQNMLLSILDWQRTPWLSLLGLGSDAVALDVGCGHGAITESLARSVGCVYALEAIPERLEFTRLRLQQEAIRNVNLVQASALDPPFPDNLFDLIVVNGVLEWVGEWGAERNPRAVQLRFLRRLHRLLKDDGIMVIGIENRFGYPAFLGAGDHSGVGQLRTYLHGNRGRTYVVCSAQEVGAAYRAAGNRSGSLCGHHVLGRRSGGPRPGIYAVSGPRQA